MTSMGFNVAHDYLELIQHDGWLVGCISLMNLTMGKVFRAAALVGLPTTSVDSYREYYIARGKGLQFPGRICRLQIAPTRSLGNLQSAEPPRAHVRASDQI